jgi:predicted enzyme related to lactoylglutathione lyase
MGRPVVHFEIIGRDPARLRAFYGELFGWTFDVGDTVAPSVSAPGEYGFVDGTTNGGANPAPVNGGVGGGPGHAPHTVFYVAVDDVEATLVAAERLGATRVLGPEGTPGTLVVGQFTDPEGNLIGVAGER